jgi:hypothetical protein
MTMQKLKSWVRLILTIAIILAAGLIILLNRGNHADLWLFHSFTDVSVIWLLIVTSLVTLVGYWIVKGVYRAYRDVKQPSEIKKDS